MRRLLYLDTQPYLRAREVAEQNQLDVFAPTRAAARGVGKPKLSLQDYAAKLLQSKGMTIPSLLEAQKALRGAIYLTIQTHDVEGTARAWMSAVQTLLRSSPLSTMTVDNCSERAKHLVQVTQRYQAILRQQNQVDAAELLWRAVEQRPERHPILIYGGVVA
jgi:hypothetical protein